MKKVFFITLLIFLLFLETAYAEDTTYLNKGYGFSIAYPSNYRVLKNLRGAPLIIFFPGKSFFFNNSILVSVSGTGAGEKSIEEYLNIYFKYDKTVSEKKEVLINGIRFLSVVQTQRKSLWFLEYNIKLYHLFTVRGTKVYTITYAADEDSFSKYLKEAKKIMESFKFI